MKLIELRIDEDPAQSLELHDLVKYFPNTYARVIKTKLRSGQLVFGGKKLITDVEDGASEDGPAIAEAIDQIDHEMAQNEGIQINITVDMPEAEGLDDRIDMTFNTKPDDKKMVFLGYHPESNSLYLGFDIWLGEDDFNEEWDRAFHEANGEDYDSDEPAHYAAFKKAWDQYKEMSFMGGMYSVKSNFELEDQLELPGGFYRGIARSAIFKQLELVPIF